MDSAHQDTGRWKAITDTDSGKVYYWDQLTNETTWTLPEGVVDCTVGHTAGPGIHPPTTPSAARTPARVNIGIDRETPYRICSCVPNVYAKRCWIGLIIVILAAGAATACFLLGGHHETSTPEPTPQPTPPPTPTPTPLPTPAPTQPQTPTPQRAQCKYQDGENAQVLKAGCNNGTKEVWLVLSTIAKNGTTWSKSQTPEKYCRPQFWSSKNECDWTIKTKVMEANQYSPHWANCTWNGWDPPHWA